MEGADMHKERLNRAPLVMNNLDSIYKIYRRAVKLKVYPESILCSKEPTSQCSEHAIVRKVIENHQAFL
jgi:hypothetical protein